MSATTKSYIQHVPFPTGYHWPPAGSTSFEDWLAAKVGTRRWCVAPRLGSRLRERYDLAIPKARYTALEREWERETFGAELARLHNAAPALLAVLRDMLTAFTDLSNGWPERELHMPPDGIISAAHAALAQLDAPTSK